MAVMAVMALWVPYIHPLCIFGIEMLSNSSESSSKKCSLVYYKCKCSPHTYKTKQQNKKKTYTEREKTYTEKQRTDTGSASRWALQMKKVEEHMSKKNKAY